MEIQLKDISKSYGKKIILENYNLVIDHNDYICIGGKSGSGKTTLINIIGLIEKFDSGEILIDKKPIRKNSDVRKLLREKIGFVFQDFGLIENETVLENFEIIQKIRRMKYVEKMNYIKTNLNYFGLDIDLNCKIYELSGGEQQRVSLAKIRAKSCEIILADEPTSSLDYENKKIVLDFLKDFHDSGKTVVVVSHDQEVMDSAIKKYLI